MRVYDCNITGMTPAEAGRTAESQRAERSDGSAGSRRTGQAGGDRVEFSAGLDQLARAISTYGAGREERVQHLTALYQSGGYQPDSMATAKAMVTERLQAG